MNAVSDIGQIVSLSAIIVLVIKVACCRYRFYYLIKTHYQFINIFFIYSACVSQLLALGRLLACTMPKFFLIATIITTLGFVVIILAAVQTLILSVTGRITAFGQLIVATSKMFIGIAITVVVPAVGIGFFASGSRKKSARYAIQSSGFQIDNSVIFVGGFVCLCTISLLIMWLLISKSVKPTILGYYINRYPEQYRKLLGLSPEVFYSYYWERTVKDPAILASIRAEQADQKSPIQ